MKPQDEELQPTAQTGTMLDRILMRSAEKTARALGGDNLRPQDTQLRPATDQMKFQRVIKAMLGAEEKDKAKKIEALDTLLKEELNFTNNRKDRESIVLVLEYLEQADENKVAEALAQQADIQTVQYALERVTSIRHEETASALLEYVDEKILEQAYPERMQWTLLHEVINCIRMTKQGFIKTEQSWEKTAARPNEQSQIFYTKILEKLVEKAPGVLEKFDQNGYLPLHFSAFWGLTDVVKILRDNPRSNINAKTAKNCGLNDAATLTGLNDQARTPIDIAIGRLKQDTVNMLLENEKIDLAVKSFGALNRKLDSLFYDSGRTPLKAARLMKAQTLQALIEEEQLDQVERDKENIQEANKILRTVITRMIAITPDNETSKKEKLRAELAQATLPVKFPCSAVEQVAERAKVREQQRTEIREHLGIQDTPYNSRFFGRAGAALRSTWDNMRISAEHNQQQGGYDDSGLSL